MAMEQAVQASQNLLIVAPPLANLSSLLEYQPLLLYADAASSLLAHQTSGFTPSRSEYALDSRSACFESLRTN